MMQLNHSSIESSCMRFGFRNASLMALDTDCIGVPINDTNASLFLSVFVIEALHKTCIVDAFCKDATKKKGRTLNAAFLPYERRSNYSASKNSSASICICSS
jgi:hypothetical protein